MIYCKEMAKLRYMTGFTRISTTTKWRGKGGGFLVVGKTEESFDVLSIIYWITIQITPLSLLS